MIPQVISTDSSYVGIARESNMSGSIGLSGEDRLEGFGLSGNLQNKQFVYLTAGS